MAVSTSRPYLSVLSHQDKGFPCSTLGKESAGSAGDLGSIPELGRSPGEGNGNPLQYPCLENSTPEKPGRLQSTESQREDMTESTRTPR